LSGSHSTLAIRRILVALDASPSSLAALRGAVVLAARMEAELLGLFVEDVDLLRLSDSPYAREILYPTAKEIPLDRASMERKLRAQAEQAREALATAAKRAQVEWSFRIVRGEVSSEVLAAAAGADLLALGRRGWSFSQKLRFGSTALAVLSGEMPALLLSESGMNLSLPVLACYDGSAAAQRGLLLAADLARTGSNQLVVLLLGEDRESARLLQEKVAPLLQGENLQVLFRPIDSRDEAGLLRAIKFEHAGILVLAGKGPLFKPDSIELLLREVDISLLFLGDDPADDVLELYPAAEGL
jgi:nucleotide-binding universal stress UspA family protein